MPPRRRSRLLGPAAQAQRLDYSEEDDALGGSLEKRQTVVITGGDFTLTLTGPLTLTQDPATATTTSTPIPPAQTSTTTTPADDPNTTSSPGVFSPVVSAVNTSPSPSVTPSSQNQNAGSTNSSSLGLPAGAIVAIVLVIVVLFLGAFVFLIRQRSMRQRKLQNSSANEKQAWGQGYPGAAPGFGQPPPQPAGSFAENGWMDEENAGASFARAQAAALAPVLSPAISHPYAAQTPTPTRPMAIPIAISSSSDIMATVTYEFIPSMPDELPIVAGEVVRVLSEYDDGWALCANESGRQGMVPLECLDIDESMGAPSESTVMPATTMTSQQRISMQSGMSSRRGSSLGHRPLP